MKEANRRTFIKGIAATALGVCSHSANADSVETESIKDTLLAKLVAEGWDPIAENTAVFAVISDGHIFMGDEYPQYRTEAYDDGLVEEINSLAPLVSELVMAGDLITYHSMTPGLPDYGRHLTFAKEEYQLAKVQMTRFNYSAWMVPGNHDTTYHEEDADMFKAQMQVPPYQKTVFAGVPVFLLNSGNAGMLDSAQEAWFGQNQHLFPRTKRFLL
jgi:hypothetical protein